MKLSLLLLAGALPMGAACPDATATPPPPADAAQDPGDEFDQSHALWTEVLAAHVHDDRFDYLALKEDRATFDRYLAQLHAVTPEELAGWTRDQRYAFWVNVYNASIVDLIVDEYPVDSIRDLGSLFTKVWDKELIPMSAHHPDGKDGDLSFNDVEHEILRPRFEDARVHAAVNCASIGCPPLQATAFTAEGLDDQLDAAMRAFVTDPRRNVLDRAKKEVRISAIFDWFEGDFERDEGSVRAYVRAFAPGEDTEWILTAKVKHLDYDWDLNDVEREDD